MLYTLYFGKPLISYIWASLFLVFGLIGVYILKRIVINRLRTIVLKTKSETDNHLLATIEKQLVPLGYITIIFMSLKSFPFPPKIDNLLKMGYSIICAIFITKFILNVVLYLLETYWISKEQSNTRKQALKAISTLLNVVIWVFAFILLLDNLGVKISALVTGLGIGGVAVALAAQTVLGDLFSYFTIFLDKPFELGDFVIVDQLMGTIEHIGLKTTRVRSLSGELLVFSNSDLTASRIRNYKKMNNRRVLFKLGVTYDTPLEKLKKIPAMIKAIIDSIENITFDRAHFATYGDFSLNFEIVYYVIGNDYNLYMDIQQEINFKIKDAFEKEQIEFAFPTQQIYLERTDKH